MAQPLGDLSGLKGSDFEFVHAGSTVTRPDGDALPVTEDSVLLTTNYYMRVGARIIDELPIITP